jgi:DNA-3-methyladenine glycosylase
MKSQILPLSFYHRKEVLEISQALLGKFLVTKIDSCVTAGMIVEVEAYHGAEDRASHAYNFRYTARTQTMYLAGGVAYVYLCYGLHHLFNVVKAPQGIPHAVLIRAIEPVEGVNYMLKRRKLSKVHYKLTAGPGVLTQAMGITLALNGYSLGKPPVWIEDRGVKIAAKDIRHSPRIGIDYAKEHKELPWRFTLKDNPWVSKV